MNGVAIRTIQREPFRKGIAILLGVVVLSYISSCEKPEMASGTPECIKQQVYEFGRYPDCSESSVDEYTFYNKKVFVFSNMACGNDLAAVVYDDQCRQLGFLGGLSGNTIIGGKPFDSAVFIRNIWHP